MTTEIFGVITNIRAIATTAGVEVSGAGLSNTETT